MTDSTPAPETPAEGMTWNDLLGKSKSLGLHAEQLFMIRSIPVAGFAPVERALDKHLPFQSKLEEQGVMFAAGPVSSADGSAWDGEGVFVYRAASLEEATLIAEQDPMHISGARRFEVRAWCLNEGTSTQGNSARP